AGANDPPGPPIDSGVGTADLIIVTEAAHERGTHRPALLQSDASTLTGVAAPHRRPAPAAPSVGARSRQDDGDRLHQDRDIAGKGPVRALAVTQPTPRLVAHVVATADLPRATEAGPALPIGFDVLAIALDFLADDRPRAGEAHLADQHVEELRQLVEARLAQER